MLKEFGAARSEDLSDAVAERRLHLLDLDRPLKPNPLFGTVALYRQRSEGHQAFDYRKALVRRFRMLRCNSGARNATARTGAS